MRALLDLVLPRECGGCGTAGVDWCRRCRAVLDDDPVAVHPRVDPGVPVWALGPYTGPRRRAVIAAKERGRRDLARPLGAALAGAVTRLRGWGELDPPELAALCLVPAPTRARAARGRGGDPVARAAEAAARALRPEAALVSPLLRMRRGVRDSVGLAAAQREANLAGRVRVRTGAVDPPAHATVLLIDDVVTTGATAAEAVRVLARARIAVAAVLVVAAA